jgi:hypothetical protein
LGAGVAALGILPAFEHLPDAVVTALAISLSPAFVLSVQVALAIGAMLVPTLLIGAAFPCAVQIAVRGRERVARDVGRLYAMNTLGAIAGTVLGEAFEGRFDWRFGIEVVGQAEVDPPHAQSFQAERELRNDRPWREIDAHACVGHDIADFR